MENKTYIVYKQGNLNFGYIDNICNCDRCKERGEAEVFINNLDGSYLDCIKYKSGYNFCDEILYVGNNLNDAVKSIESYYNNKLNTKKLENNFLQSLVDMANSELMK